MLVRRCGCVGVDRESSVMVVAWRALALLAALRWCGALPEPMYHNQFAVHVPAGDDHVHRIAKRHGFVNHGQVSQKNKFVSSRAPKTINDETQPSR